MVYCILVSYLDLQHVKAGSSSSFLSALRDVRCTVRVLFDARELSGDGLLDAVATAERQLRLLGFPDGTILRVSVNPSATTICGALQLATSECEIWKPKLELARPPCPLTQALGGQIRSKFVG